MGPRRLLGRRARRLVAEALAEARRRRPSSATGPVLAPFALVARGEGSIELEVTEAGDGIEALVGAIAAGVGLVTLILPRLLRRSHGD